MGKHKKSASQRGYDATWRKARETKLAADPLCEPCKAKGITTAAQQVHHLKRFRRKDGSIDHGLRLRWSNLQSICETCHEEATALERAEDQSGTYRTRGCDENGRPLDPTHPWA